MFGTKASGVPQPAKLPEPALRAAVDGKGYLIVGGTKGLGEAAAAALRKRGASVTVVGRTENRALSAIGVTHVTADLSLMATANSVASTLSVDAYDAILLTTGIIAASERELSTEGIEMDLAVSYLSRLVILRNMLDRGFGRGAGPRKAVFIMGAPGARQGPAQLDDLNWDRTPYKAMPCHENTIFGNEALVSVFGRRYPDVQFFGLNPGLIRTEIRKNLLGEGCFSRFVEGVIGLTNISAGLYAERTLVQLLASTELRAPPMNGILFSQDGTPITGGAWISEAVNAEKVIAASEAFLKERVHL